MVNIFVSTECESKTVYIDLCSFSGNHISGAKLRVEDYRAEGSILIPDSLRTGTYLLRTFYHQDHQKKLHVRDLLIANRFEDFTNNFTGQFNKIEGDPFIENTDMDIEVPDTLERKETNILKLSVGQDLINQLEGGLCVSVSKYNGSFQSSENHYTEQISSNESAVTENNGLVISGKVINKTSRMPVSDATVFLSVSDSIPGFQYDISGKDGSFHFPLKNIYGTLPLVIQAIKENENDQLLVVLDEKFNFKLPQLSVKPLVKDNAMAEELKNIAEAFTYSKIFYDQPLASESADKNHACSYLFYGEPTYVVQPDEFYNLPDFSEISRELLMGVKFRDKNNQLSLNVMDTEAGDYFDEQAFLLVDGIPVQDLGIIKEMGTNQISWIHTVLEYRFFGDITFPGVVSIHTQQQDFKWLKESDRLIKYEFEGLQLKERKTEQKLFAHYPDLRPVLLWEPNKTPSHEMKFDFSSSDIAGDYRVRITGKKKNGEIIHSEKIIHIN